ncbi:MAG: tRNA 2-thiouridine(34) synthase MnmA [Prevotella sp.]|nr:tRNA 2-thiouridine(34) synthase MnmA [Prevotella sp.]
MNLQNRRIAVLLSGGVDSSVVLYELVRQGLRPDCFYIKIGPDQDEEWDCSSEEDLEMATAVSHKYGCKLEIVDCHREYWDQVTAYTMDKVRAGLTPNPDVMCNRLIKFGAFDEKRGHDYDLIATGHYAQTERDEQGGKWLCTSPDPVKDQTDFLAQIYDWQLRKALFPIGHMMKEEVREIAEREHLVNAKRKDSQGICFLGKINYNDYIRRFLGEQSGDVLELETGKRIGQHKGLWFHTIGQRHGLGFGGGPWFVVKKDMQQNILYVSKGYDPQTAYKQEFLFKDFHSLIPGGGSLLSYPTVTFKIRHTPEFHQAKLQAQDDGIYKVNSEVPIHGVAPGQFCVLYDEAHHRCLGSGEITL